MLWRLDDEEDAVETTRTTTRTTRRRREGATTTRATEDDDDDDDKNEEEEEEVVKVLEVNETAEHFVLRPRRVLCRRGKVTRHVPKQPRRREENERGTVLLGLLARGESIRAVTNAGEGLFLRERRVRPIRE